MLVFVKRCRLLVVKFMSRIHYIFLLTFIMTGDAVAAVTGGAMPWETPLQKIEASIAGPVAKILGVIVIVIAGLGIAFGEAGSGVRRLFQVVLGLAIAFSAASIIATLYTSQSGVVF